MMNNTRRPGASLALALTVILAACSVEKTKTDTTLATDTALKNDLALANRDSTAQPALQDVPANAGNAAPAAAPAPAPTRTAPRPTPRPTTSRPTTSHPSTPAPAPSRPTTTATGNTVTSNTGSAAGSSGGGSVGTIASGTTLALRSNSRVCTNTYQVGQTFSATVADAVSGSNGATIPAGATVSLEITQLKRSENANDKIVMEFAVRSVTFGGRTYPVSAQVANADIERVRNQPKDKDVQKVVGGAVIGAIAGQILGRSTKSTVIGAAAGAAAGTGAAVATANYEGCVPDGGSISVSLNSPLQVKITS